jgi:DNA-directed RNA polymerase subunit RPC12/RpoP
VVVIDMVVIKGKIIAKPQKGTRPIHRKRNDKKSSVPGPLMRGKAGGRLKYVCGSCGYLLTYNVSRKEISVDAVFQCPNCNKYNEA